MDEAAFERELEGLLVGDGLAASVLKTLLQLHLNPKVELHGLLPGFGYAQDTRLTSAQAASLVEHLHRAATELGPRIPGSVVSLYAYTGDDRTAGFVIPLIYQILAEPGPDANSQLNQLLTALTVHSEYPGVTDAIAAVAAATNLPKSHLDDAREDARHIIRIWKDLGHWPKNDRGGDG